MRVTSKFLSAAAAGAALLLFAAACTNIAVFDYDGAPGTLLTFPGKGSPDQLRSVSVLPFTDMRGIPGSAVGDSGSFYLGLIPLMPFGFVEKQEPENSKDFVSLGRYHFDPANHLAEAAQKSLAASGCFSRVKRAPSFETADTDLVWEGTFKNTSYRGYYLTYGITYFFAPVLWIVGAPNGVSCNELEMEFSLRDRATGRKIWTYSFAETDSVTHWIYARNGKDVSRYPVLMKQAMNAALYDLSRNGVPGR